MATLQGITVAVLATDGFEEAELVEPAKALRDAGARIDIIAPKAGEIQAFKHHDKSIRVKVDKTLDQVDAGDYDAVLLPGGALNADAMRAEPKVKQFLQDMQQGGKPFAIICHAPWEVVSAGLARGRTMTSYHTIQDDLRNAGADWIDREVVVDGNWVMSRKPDDIPAFNREMEKLFASRQPATR